VSVGIRASHDYVDLREEADEAIDNPIKGRANLLHPMSTSASRRRVF
jgi:hypothetical protein